MRIKELRPGIFSAEIERDPSLPPISEESKEYFLRLAESQELRFFLEDIIAIVNKQIDISATIGKRSNQSGAFL